MLFVAGVELALVNLHYLADQVREYVSTRPDSDRIVLVEEPELLGTAGTVKQNHGFFNDAAGLVIHADNFCLADLKSFILAHDARPEGAELTMMTFVSDDPSSCGIVEMDEAGVVHGFHEKVENPPGNIANGAIYIFEPTVLEFIVSSTCGEMIDVSTDVLPHYLGRIFAVPADGALVDIGTPENLAKAQSIW